MFESLKKITLNDMVEFLNDKTKEEQEWFLGEAFDDNGKYQHLKATRAFCGKYMPELLPNKSNKTRKSDILLQWAR